MIRVKVELDKWGLGSDVKQLGELLIINDGTGSAEQGNYEFNLIRTTGAPPWGGAVRSFNRSYDVFELIYKCLSVSYSREAGLISLLRRAAPFLVASSWLSSANQRPVDEIVSEIEIELLRQ